MFIQYYHLFRKWQGDGDSNLFLHRFLGSFRFVFLQNMIPQEDSINAISDILQNQFLIKVLALVLITLLLVVHDYDTSAERMSHDINGAGWSNRMLHRKLKYSICFLTNIRLRKEKALSNNIHNTSISSVKSSCTTL